MVPCWRAMRSWVRMVSTESSVSPCSIFLVFRMAESTTSRGSRVTATIARAATSGRVCQISTASRWASLMSRSASGCLRAKSASEVEHHHGLTGSLRRLTPQRVLVGEHAELACGQERIDHGMPDDGGVDLALTDQRGQIGWRHSRDERDIFGQVEAVELAGIGVHLLEG